MVTGHGQRRHAHLVNQQAAAVGPPVREYLQVGEIGQSAPEERGILSEKPTFDLDEEVGPMRPLSISRWNWRAPFVTTREMLRAACWAKDVKVSHHVRYAHLVALDVIRHEPSAERSSQSWYGTGTPDGLLAIPAPREPAEKSYWLGEPPHGEQPRWLRV